MKRLIIAFITWMLVGVTVTAAWAAGPAKPVIEAEMPDCYSYIGGSGITLYTNASASDGGTLKYQWYVTDIENMAMIRAIDYAEGESYQVPEELAQHSNGLVKCRIHACVLIDAFFCSTV